MKRKPNYLKHLLQWGVLAAIVGTVLWAKFSDKPVDVEAYCPFGGLQAFGTYVVNNSKIKRALGIDSLPVNARKGLLDTFNSFKEQINQ